MMLELANSSLQNLISPITLFFFWGVLMGAFKSHLEVPAGFGRVLAFYLVLAIGFKGGVQISQSTFSYTMVGALVGGVLFSFFLPFLGYWLAQKITRLSQLDSAALSAHFGSVSLVTFLACMNFLKGHDEPFEPYLVGVLAFMETPAIISGLYLAYRKANSTDVARLHWKDIVFNGGVLLLLGCLFIGLITGERGMAKMAGLISLPFEGLLCLFLLEMGVQVGRQLPAVREQGLPLVLYGILMPFLAGLLGLGFGTIIGLEPGGCAMFAILCGSASYIVVPAVLRMGLPSANLPLCVSVALAVTFPFNMVVGIPLYYSLAKTLATIR